MAAHIQRQRAGDNDRAKGSLSGTGNWWQWGLAIKIDGNGIIEELKGLSVVG